MTAAHLCVRCGAVLAVDAPDGLCPSCRGQPETAPGRTTPELPGLTGPFLAPVPPVPADLAGHFPSLEILGLLGQGGMGTVYKARQLRLDRLVALKVLSVRSASDAFAERFLREARALAQLNHPHVVTIHDFGEAGPFYYFLMELVEGGSLRNLLRAGRRPLAEVLPLIVQACDALQYAHDEGIIHRDVKPDNLLLDRRGQVKVADFGLARLLGPAPAFTLTGSQQAMGTLHYVAPEQWEAAHRVDHRADLYALGVVLYELLMGELPLGRFPLPSQKGVDPRLDDVVLRALEKDPENRYQRAADLRADVEAILTGSPTVGVASHSAPLPIAPPPTLPATQVADVSRALSSAGREVSGPAIGLFVTGMLSILLPVGCAGMFGAAWVAMLTLLGVPFGIVMILAARKMRRLEAPEFALVGSILALIPIGPAWVVGLPIGIWSLLVLRKPEVRAAFAVPKSAGAAIAWPRWVPRSWAVWTIAVCALGLLSTVPPWVTSAASEPPGFLTWPGLAVALLVLLLGSCLLAAQRTWPDAVRRRAVFLRSCLRILLVVAGLGMLLFLVLLLVMVGRPGGADPGTSLAVAWFAFAVLLMAVWFVRGRDWQAVATILTGLAIIVIIGLLLFNADTAPLKNVFIVPAAQGRNQAGLPLVLLFPTLLALTLTAGLVLLGAGRLVSVIRTGRSIPIPAGEADAATGRLGADTVTLPDKAEGKSN